ncbi:MAG: hypothetical protein H6557_23215 [Lewinellaceae bacterium]|nr:hypothetical protein [Phaeodactylibacter sp.]MCB9039538.1 hypothetical protein [Lewinellaceae bacterium]
MTAVTIGIVSGFLTILAIRLMKLMDKPVIYGLILSGIGFLYVGFTWSDTPSLLITSIQAFCFLLLAYFGIRKNINFLIAGYFLHGIWDFIYGFFPASNLIPPHYDLFCLSIDFTIGAYLLMIRYRIVKTVPDIKI